MLHGEMNEQVYEIPKCCCFYTFYVT
ncbi:MAG: hypothetical protein ACI8XG_001208, partial [Congregibacter sp.]